MKVNILQGIDGAKRAKGTAVVIDVFRAFSLECYLYGAGAARILPVGEVETAYQLKKNNPEYILIGERHGKILPGFNFGNSPSQIKKKLIIGRTLVHTTSAGTQGIKAACTSAEEVLTGSLVNAKAIARYIQQNNPAEVSIICMGKNGTEETPEDTLCGEYIKSLLEGTSLELQKRIEMIRNHKEGQKFFDPNLQTVFPQKDYAMCMDIDRFDMVLKIIQIEEDVFESVLREQQTKV